MSNSKANDFVREIVQATYGQHSIDVIAKFLGVTRQTVSRINKGDEVAISKRVQKNIEYLLENGEVKKNKVLNLIKLKLKQDELFQLVSTKPSDEVCEYLDLLKYIEYWAEKDDKRHNYLRYLNVHMQNFHMRMNPYALFSSEFFDKDLKPVLTFDIDSENERVKNVTLGSIISNKNKFGYDLNYQKMWDDSFGSRNYSYVDFIDNITSLIDGKLRFNIYIDHIDNQIEYLMDRVPKNSKEKLKSLKYFDLSRLFRTVKGTYPIEDVMRLFFDIDEEKLLTNAVYRNKYLIKLYRLITGAELDVSSAIDKIMFTTDNEHFDKKDHISKEVSNRRKLKGMK